MRSSANVESQTTAVVLQALLVAEGARLSRQTLLKRFWKEGINAETLNAIVGSLENAGILIIHRSEFDVIYELKPSFVEKYYNTLKEKKQAK